MGVRFGAVSERHSGDDWQAVQVLGAVLVVDVAAGDASHAVGEHAQVIHQ